MLPKSLWVPSFPVYRYAKSFTQDLLIQILRTGPLPKHIAFIMDGNRRFAKSNNLRLVEGHVAGSESLLRILELCYQLGIKTVTVYAFSIENFNRPKNEQEALFELIRSKLLLMVEKSSIAEKYGISIRILGDRSLIPVDILAGIESTEESTKNNSKSIFNICFPYTSRNDIAHAIKSVVNKAQNGEIRYNTIGEQTLEREMYTGQSEPLDILVRTSGVSRLSDFMLWESHQNCWIEFIDELWPEFKAWNLYVIILKWSYYKAKELKDLELTQAKRFNNETGNGCLKK
ncbi:Di-trans-poly-cis-decaprenylcistransferase [Nadsonia fulvescens var. elongata DSM 6958]|uniref:Alkyl transferase n=1 Tax=Nadsonia fulvescens var. elongata DSM 6958 TaxID=857566 RepID=A0A1E3PP48_9ASCO|nr:Di-trans-poly-cis-decaprenylcistransferase [Nadsonia fulvescens var. elongata DSM 6958]